MPAQWWISCRCRPLPRTPGRSATGQARGRFVAGFSWVEGLWMTWVVHAALILLNAASLNVVALDDRAQRGAARRLAGKRGRVKVSLSAANCAELVPIGVTH